MRELLIAMLVVLAGPACSIKRLALNQTVEVLLDGEAAFNSEEDLVLAEAAAAASLKMAEGMLVGVPDNRDLRMLLARGFGGYALAFVEDRWEATGEEREEEREHLRRRASRLYLRGRAQALAVLEMDHPGATKTLLEGDVEALDAFLPQAESEDVPALFWIGYCWGGWVNLNRDSQQAIADISKVERIMARVLELDESYYFGGAHLFFAVYYGTRPKMLGGDLDKAREHLEAAHRLSENKLLLVDVFEAQVAVQAQDRDAFERALKRVIEAPPDLFPEQRLANQLARRKAVRMLARADDLFL